MASITPNENWTTVKTAKMGSFGEINHCCLQNFVRVTIHRLGGELTGEGSHISKRSIQTPPTFVKHNFEKQIDMFPRLVETKEEILTLLEIRGNKEESVDQSRPSRFLEDTELRLSFFDLII